MAVSDCGVAVGVRIRRRRALWRLGVFEQGESCVVDLWNATAARWRWIRAGGTALDVLTTRAEIARVAVIATLDKPSRLAGQNLRRSTASRRRYALAGYSCAVRAAAVGAALDIVSTGTQVRRVTRTSIARTGACADTLSALSTTRAGPVAS